MSEVMVTFVHSPDWDWVGMYVDGRLMDQGHSLQAADVARLLITGAGLDNMMVESREDWDVEQDGHLPPKLRDVSFGSSG